jgi:hypothetical protein
VYSSKKIKMQLQKIETQIQQPSISPTPKDKIETAIRNGHITKEAGQLLLQIHSRKSNLNPDDVTRHNNITDSVTFSASQAGIKPRLH